MSIAVAAPSLAELELATLRLAIEPARIYDLRSTFAPNALAANVTVLELAKIMGTSVRMIEKHYGALIGGAHAGIAGRLDALEAELEQAAPAQP